MELGEKQGVQWSRQDGCGGGSECWWGKWVDSGHVKGSPNLRDQVSRVRDGARVFTPSSWKVGGLFLRLGGWVLEEEGLRREVNEGLSVGELSSRCP